MIVPNSIHGRKVSKAGHKAWKAAMAKTGDPKQAMGALKKAMGIGKKKGKK